MPINEAAEGTTFPLIASTDHYFAKESEQASLLGVSLPFIALYI